MKILATAPVKGMFILSVYATFGRNWKQSFKVILKITKQVYTNYNQKEKLNFFFMAQAHILKRY